MKQNDVMNYQGELSSPQWKLSIALMNDFVQNRFKTFSFHSICDPPFNPERSHPIFPEKNEIDLLFYIGLYG